MSAPKTSTNFFLIAAAMLLTLTACTREQKNENDPKQRLTDYISTSFSIHDVSDRQKLEAYLTGGAKNRLIAWSEEQFRQAFVDNKREKVKLSIREVKPVNDKRTNIVYELTYIDQGRGPDAKVTTKRMCEMSLEDGKWFISEVKNIKELIEYKNEISIVY